MKMNKAACVAAALLATCGWGWGQRTAGIAVERGVLEVADRGFAECLEVVQDQTVVLDGGFLKAQVTLRNTGGRDEEWQYRFTWKDRDGMTLKGAETLWTALPLHGAEETVLEAVCPVPGAADFRLTVRPIGGR